MALTIGFSACEEKQDQPLDSVDLRYRVNDSYDLDAVSPQAFTIVVKSTKPWTIRSYHPDWCIISEEEGEAQPDSLVHVGKGENTYVKVQYYDNTDLDDRVDYIEIASNGYIGKKVTIYQKGIAFLRVPDDEQEFMIEKSGGEAIFNIISNQPWSTKILEMEGNWLTIAEGAAGELTGRVKLVATENSGEKRYASVSVFDRNGEERAVIKITQDGVQLDPESFELHVGYDQTSSSIHVVANSKWIAKKASDTDTWFEIVNPDGHNGDDTINLTFQDNSAGTSLRRSSIIITTVAAKEGDAVAEKEIVIKQAYPISPERVIMNGDEICSWKSDWDNLPSYTKDVGALFEAKARLNRSMPFGTYTFRWSTIQTGVRVRHWFCFSDGAELKVDPRITKGYVSFDFNASSTGGKPSLSAFEGVDFSQPVEITYKFDPSGSEYCHVTYLCNGVVAGSFDTSEEILPTVKGGSESRPPFGS